MDTNFSNVSMVDQSNIIVLDNYRTGARFFRGATTTASKRIDTPKRQCPIAAQAPARNTAFTRGEKVQSADGATGFVMREIQPGKTIISVNGVQRVIDNTKLKPFNEAGGAA